MENSAFVYTRLLIIEGSYKNGQVFFYQKFWYVAIFTAIFCDISRSKDLISEDKIPFLENMRHVETDSTMEISMSMSRSCFIALSWLQLKNENAISNNI